ncbi:MAG: hypothetical protein WAO83_18090 [Fuerstiella sp.]
MQSIPVISHHTPRPSATMLARMERLARDVLGEHPEFSVPDVFKDHVPVSLNAAPSIHVDDYSAITRFESGQDISFYQSRCRLRAVDGDVVIACGPPIDGYEAYCQNHLGLGQVDWLYPAVRENPVRIAEAAWEDRSVRREIIYRMRHSELEYLHPHMGTLPVWELATLLRKSSRRPLQVIAPLPALTQWTNDKVAFTQTVTRLFGEGAVPESDSAWNESTLVPKLREIAEHCGFVGIKLPDSAGGDGNIVIDASEIRGKSLSKILELVHSRMPQTRNHNSRLLIDAWQTDVLCSPSVQTWIPPVADGPPIVEGIFEQATVGANGQFVGHQPAQFPHTLTEQIAERSWLLASLYQRLGYVGRCSLDLILVGKDTGSCHIEFIECNGRWGGTSLPMTMLNRVLGDYGCQPYVSQIVNVPGFERLSFADLAAALSHDLYDTRTGNGSIILFNPGRLKAQSGIDVIDLGGSGDVTARIAECINTRSRSVDGNGLRSEVAKLAESSDGPYDKRPHVI